MDIVYVHQSPVENFIRFYGVLVDFSSAKGCEYNVPHLFATSIFIIYINYTKFFFYGDFT